MIAAGMAGQIGVYPEWQRAAAGHTRRSFLRATSPISSITSDGRAPRLQGARWAAMSHKPFATVYPQRTTAIGLIDTTAWYGADCAGEVHGACRRGEGQRDERTHRLPADTVVL
jgi:cellulase/cellobiase CelA1